MKRLSKEIRSFFEECGRRGGRSRARRLSSPERSAIAARAAVARWKRVSSPFFPSVRLEVPRLTDPVYLEEVLSFGAWKDWQRLYKIIADQPFGETASALERVCSSVEIYGATALWQGILRLVQGGFYEEGE